MEQGRLRPPALAAQGGGVRRCELLVLSLQPAELAPQLRDKLELACEGALEVSESGVDGSEGLAAAAVVGGLSARSRAERGGDGWSLLG